MATYYCTADDVAVFLGLGSGYFTATSKPAKEEVEAIINQYEDWIDFRTQHAWRGRKVDKWEYHRLGYLGNRGNWFVWMGFPIFLRHRSVKQFDKGQGDEFQVFNGSSWEDWLTTKTEGMTGDYWVDYDNGIVYVFGYWRYVGFKDFMVRFKYRYGESTVPQDIKRACVLLTAAHLVSVNDKLFLIPEGGTGVLSIREKVELWRQEANDILDARREWAMGGAD